VSQIVYCIFFLIFLGIVIALRVACQASLRRGMVTILVLYILAVHVILAGTRRDAWPFSVHGIFLESGDERRPLSNVAFIVVDRNGQEHHIDPDSWSPIHERTLDVWWLVNFARLNAEDRRLIMRFLLQRAEEARRARESGRRIGPPRLLGFAAAPFWYSVDLMPPRSNQRYVGLRAYLVTRIPGKKLAEGAESRRLMAEVTR
jgi:hypothetical protein